MKETPDFYRLAARFYQFEDLPDNYLDMDCDEFYEHLQTNAWEPFEGWRGKDIHAIIESLSVRMENIARETRKNTLDEVREALNIN
ncbi:MAG: hypothetical protein ACPGII_10235 [Opitutales bacterium]